MRMRLTLKFLIKSLIALVVLIFALPMLIHHLDSQEWKKLDEVARMKREKVSVVGSHIW
jgi:p-aminobenzoyl-glutamate transporter AbgT